MTQTFFPVGATYAPLPKATEIDEAEWPRDIARMAESGLTVLRLFICWDRVERARGCRDFSRIDRVFNLAAENGLRVIANVGGTFTNLQAIYPPRFLVYDENCALVKPTPESGETLHANRVKLCYDDPRYQELAREFIQAAVGRYHGHPSLLAWSGWNEPRLAECHCRHSLAAFRAWLARRHGGLDELARAWGTEFPLYFRTWEDVFPQTAAGFEDGGYVPWLDWRRFLAWNRADKFHRVRDWIKEIDARTPVISHLCGPYDADIFGGEDILGTSVYTMHGQGRRPDDFTPYEFATRQQAHLMAMGRRDGRNDPEGFWVVETEGGSVAWVHNLVPRTYSPRQMNARDLFLVAHGARAVLRWLYRSRVTDAQAGEFNLVGWDGRVTERARAFGELSRFLNRHADPLLRHVEDDSGVRLLSADDTFDLAMAEGYGTRYARSLERLHNALLHLGVRPRCCNRRQALEGGLAGAKALLVPFRPYVDAELAERLRAFVSGGGLLVAEFPFALKDADGRHHVETPGGMTDLFGARVWDLEKLFEPTCGSLPAFDFKARIALAGGTASAHYADGAPAVVEHRYGAGRTVLYGSPVFAAYRLEDEGEGPGPRIINYEEGETLREELRVRLAGAGVFPAHVLDELTPSRRKHIQVIFRRLPEGERLLFVLNLDSQANRFALRFDGAAEAVPLGGSDAPERIVREPERWVCNLDAWGWAVWRLKN